MGKKSVQKSPSKKKTTKAKTDAENNVAIPAGNGEIKASPKKAKASKKQEEVKAEPAAAKPVETKKAPAKKEKTLSLKELLMLKFDVSKPEFLYVPKTDDARDVNEAPPFVSGLDPAETERVRKLLFKTFDLNVPDSAPAEPVPSAVVEPEPVAIIEPPVVETAPEPPPEPVSIEELLKLKFDIVTPAVLYVPPAFTTEAVADAPPFVSGLDPAETERVRKLLFKTFDLSVPDPAPAEPVPAAVVEPEPVAAVETPVVETAPEPVSIEELLKLKFDIVAPAVLYVPPASATEAVADAPPFVSGLDPAETERVRKLLFKTFDLSVPDPAPAEPEPAAVVEPAPEPEVAAVPPAEPEAMPEKEPESEPPVSEVETTVAAAVTEPAHPIHAVEAEPAVEMPSAPAEPEKTWCVCFQEMDPLVKKAIGAGCILAAVFLLIILTSISNMSKYYLKSKGNAVEVLKGRFAPLGTDRVAVLTDVKLQKKTDSSFTRAEIAPLVIDNYVRRADELMVSKGIPDYETIRTLLKDALAFAETETIRQGINDRLNRIELTSLLYKATSSIGKDTRADLEAAREYLTKAGWLAKDKNETDMIQSKLKAVNDKLSVPPPLKQSPPAKPSTKSSGH